MNQDHKFEVHCDAGNAGHLHTRTDSVSIRIGQRVKRNGMAEIWDSLIILCEETKQGTLSAKVIVCHPDWDQQLQIAHLQSPATGPRSSVPRLEFDLKPAHV